ncbi:MAG: hypothetical protein ACUZ8E_18515, partial [Candidatus Anammoxibacter sp.]
MIETKYDKIAKLCGKRKNDYELSHYLSKTNMRQFKEEMASYFGCDGGSIVYSDEPEFDSESGTYKFTVSMEICYTLNELDDNGNAVERSKTKVVTFDLGLQRHTVAFIDKQFPLSDKCKVFDEIYAYIQDIINAWDGK